MIQDLRALRAVRDGWEFIRHSRNAIVGNCNLATWTVGFNQTGMRDLCFNLLLASAFSVLEDALKALRSEQVFVSKDDRLRTMMKASHTVLPWQDWPLLNQARVERNASIHDRNYLPHALCRDYLAGIETELVSWKILPTAAPELWHW